MLTIKKSLLVLSIAFTHQVIAQTDILPSGIDGSITIYDARREAWFYTDTLDARRLTLPAATFKIINSLIALETKAVKDENQVLKWDHIPKTFLGTAMPQWNKDTDMKMAFENSTTWFYEELAKRIKRNTYKKYLQACHYGNLDLSEKGIDFWNYGNFGVSPINQVMFLRKLYLDKLPFSKKHMAIVKEMMISERTDQYILRDKTGMTRKDGQDIGWWVGYIETEHNVFFFATRLTKSAVENDEYFTSHRKVMTKRVLHQLSTLN